MLFFFLLNGYLIVQWLKKRIFHFILRPKHILLYVPWGDQTGNALMTPDTNNSHYGWVEKPTDWGKRSRNRNKWSFLVLLVPTKTNKCCEFPGGHWFTSALKVTEISQSQEGFTSSPSQPTSGLFFQISLQVVRYSLRLLGCCSVERIIIHVGDM